MAEKVAILLDNVNELLEKVVIEQEKQKNIIEQLNLVEQPYKLILEKAYIQGKSLVTIASEIGYNYKHMCKMNGIALKKFEQHDKKGVITTQKYVIYKIRDKKSRRQKYLISPNDKGP